MPASKSDANQPPAVISPDKPNILHERDVQRFRESAGHRLYEMFGSHRVGEATSFAVWAPSAQSVSVIGEFNAWNKAAHPLENRDGIWSGVVPEARNGCRYKYHIVSRENAYTVDKADPFAFYNEEPPQTASRVWDLDYEWHDAEWMRNRHVRNADDRPISIYEVHLGSWCRVHEQGNRFLTYREMAPLLTDYLRKMNFTHVEFMPVMEHPFYGSWGYQVTGYFAPTARYGTPQDLMYMVDQLHQAGSGVILDWVPSHFPKNEHGLGYFDGTHLYEYSDPRKGEHADWGSYVFDYGRPEVRSFLMSSAMFWLDRYHIDALRVDGVASMLYLDYGRAPGQWVPNQQGGRENLEAIDFLRQFNTEVRRAYPDARTIAEESTSWPKLTHPASEGGIGFGMKWDMGWMHDTLKYMSQDPINRKHHHNELTFRGMYAFDDKFVLSLSHDEVVYGRRSLHARMPGDDWQKAANLRLLYGYMYTQPGKKLLFMGDEFGQRNEWHHDRSLDWHELDDDLQRGVQRWVEELNRYYRDTPALYQLDFDSQGYEWINADDAENSVLTYVRHGNSDSQMILVVCNFTPVPRYNYRVGAPKAGVWREALNSDAREYGGSGQGNMGEVETAPVPYHGRPFSLNLVLPPLATIIFESP